MSIAVLVMMIMSGCAGAFLMEERNIEKRYELIKEKTKLELKLLRADAKRYEVEEECSRIWQRKCELERELEARKANISSRTMKEMMKFAMVQAHPDKPNGSTEKFVKFKEEYDRLYK